MKKITLYLALMLFISCNSQEKTPTNFTVMAWNILHGGNDIENGVQNVIKIIKEINPDVILMIETYGSGKMIADSLGYNFHLIASKDKALDDKSINLSIYSKFPFGERIDTDYPFYLGGSEIIIDNQRINVFSNWFHYEPWDDEPENLGKSTEELLEWEKSGAKHTMLQKVLPYIKKYAAMADSIPMIFGGDLNTPSHLDWGPESKTLHNDLVVPWFSTTVLQNIGMIDTYRSLNPNSLKYPGITWNTKEVKDSHRIDYIFYKGMNLKAVKSETYMAFLNDIFSINGKEIRYPSDHGFVVTTFEL